MRYSPLTQINRKNVAKLKVAWVFHTGDVSDGKKVIREADLRRRHSRGRNAIRHHRLQSRYSLDPETGKQRWAYDPKLITLGIMAMHW